MVIAVAALEEQTNKLIEETAKRVFVGTATAQNGRLDTLIVFGLVTHLIYKITQLHSQRPHINDLLLLYKNVALTAFFAGALEDVVIEEYTSKSWDHSLPHLLWGAFPVRRPLRLLSPPLFLMVQPTLSFACAAE